MTETLRLSLRRLDGLLQTAAAKMRTAQPSAAADSFRGLYIDAPEVERLLKLEPGEPTLWVDDTATADPVTGESMHWLQETFQLSPFDIDVLLIALAPELTCDMNDCTPICRTTSRAGSPQLISPLTSCVPVEKPNWHSALTLPQILRSSATISCT